MNHYHEQHPEHLDEDVALAPGHLFARIIASRCAALLGRLDALRIQNRRCGVRLASRTLPHAGAQAIINPLPDTSPPPAPEIAVHGGLRWVLPRQIAPGNAGATDIE